jgi:D-sedoheptulose 7-phosphate isomerase
MAIDFKSILAQHRRAIDCVEKLAPQIEQTAQRLAQVFADGHRVYTCGNGGSAADAQHFAAELTGRYQKDRRGYPAVSLTTDTSALTAISNDYGFDHVFARQLEALAQPGDMLFAISTSGNSPNIVKTVEYARQHDIITVGLLGRDGGKLRDMMDSSLIIDVQDTARIQEAHILVLHLLCEHLES